MNELIIFYRYCRDKPILLCLLPLCITVTYQHICCLMQLKEIQLLPTDLHFFVCFLFTFIFLPPQACEVVCTAPYLILINGTVYKGAPNEMDKGRQKRKTDYLISARQKVYFSVYHLWDHVCNISVFFLPSFMFLFCHFYGWCGTGTRTQSFP